MNGYTLNKAKVRERERWSAQVFAQATLLRRDLDAIETALRTGETELAAAHLEDMHARSFELAAKVRKDPSQ